LPLQGIVRLDRKTKNLVRRLRPGDIAVIAHEDLDEVAAAALLQRRVKAVINAYSFITGRYPNPGPEKLAKSGVLLLDRVGDGVFANLHDGQKIIISGSSVFYKNKLVARGQILDLYAIEQLMQQGKRNLAKELDRFVNNTLKYAAKEKAALLGPIKVPELDIPLKGKHVLVVARGKDYRQDLLALKPYIEEIKPVLMGVDGGADALLELGFQPQIIVGDMDSISNQALSCGCQLIVHAYPNGDAPGLERLLKLGLKPSIFSIQGTSEDAALLIAYEKGAELIVGVGLHSNLIDFLEKGRPGMASTLLVRLKVGSILVDAKGVNELYQGGLRLSYFWGVLFAGLVPLLLIFFISPKTQYFLQIILLKFKLLVGLL
jgi:uncharacterized membrane-anchored protein